MYEVLIIFMNSHFMQYFIILACIITGIGIFIFVYLFLIYFYIIGV